MPITPTYPGVYIEEVPSGVRTIVGVSTSVAAFIGYFARGPLNQAVQIFNMGDFQREFGGLHRDSETSYAIDQFFKNKGSEAWVVRTASGDINAASIVLQDDSGSDVLRATAGRLMKGTSVDDPGTWGNNLRIDVDYDTMDTENLFNLTVSEMSFQDGRQTVIQAETYRNLTMTANTSNNAIEVVNEGSRLIQLSRDTAWTLLNRPAQTGTGGTSAPGALGVSSGNTFNITYATSSSSQGPVEITIPTTPTTFKELSRILQSAIRTAGAALITPEPLLTGATVQLIGVDQFRVLAGRTARNFDAETTLTFTEFGGSTAADLGLIGAAANVQQYSLGSANTWGYQHAETGSLPGHNGNQPGATELRGIRLNKSGLYALEDVDLFNILCIPRAAEISDEEAMRAVYSDALTYCEERRAFLIIDIPETTNNLQDARDWLDDNALFRHRNAAAYFPRPRIPDPLNNYRLKSVGASGTIAGLYARTDATRGVWKAPAGIEAALRNVPDLDYKLTDPENGQLNPLGLNCLRNFDIYGNVCWGSRTLMGADQQASEWKYVPVRRIALFIEESLFRGTQWVVFEPNDEPLWAQIRLNLGAFMHNLFRQGAFQGTTPREAYLVKCDSETTTQNDINLGIVNILVGFAPLKPAEFVIIKIQQLAGQVEA